MKRKRDQFPPLTLLNSISNKFPKAWEQMELFHNQNGQDGLPHWQDWCYAPFAAAAAVIGSERMGMQEVQFMSAIAALAPWRLSKQVYRLDPDMEKLLTDQDDTSIPGEILYHLPFPCFYVELTSDAVSFNNVHGFFVHLEDDVKEHEHELRFLFVDKDGKVIFGYPIHIGAGTIRESQNQMLSTAKNNMPEMGETLDLLKNSRAAVAMEAQVAKCLQIVLYLCASNKEVTPRENAAETTQSEPKTPEQEPEPSDEWKIRQSEVKDRYQELRQWDVGIRVGAAIRMSQETKQAASQGGTHASPRPHMRRGHWHHFWTGKRNDPGNRVLVLHWIPPLAINADHKTEAVIRIQDVKP